MDIRCVATCMTKYDAGRGISWPVNFYTAGNFAGIPCCIKIPDDQFFFYLEVVLSWEKEKKKNCRITR